MLYSPFKTVFTWFGFRYNGGMDSQSSPVVDKSPERIRQMFDAVASRYDFLNHLLSLGIDRSWRSRAARQLIQHGEGDVLDVCCGTGDLSLALLKQQRKQNIDRTIYGVDFSPAMLEIARKKVPQDSALHFSPADALDLPFEENRFALVAVAFGLRNVHDTQRGLAEMLRVCKPGGTVAVLDFSMPTLPILRHVYQFYFRTVLPRIGQWIGNDRNRAYNYLTESVVQFDRPEQLAKRMKHLGMIDVRMKPMTFGIVTLIWGKNG